MALNALTLPFGGFGRERMWQKRALERELEGAALKGEEESPLACFLCIECTLCHLMLHVLGLAFLS